ncbi:hydantoinase B/oxoprolinase family protein [Planomonospora algeriensis]
MREVLGGGSGGRRYADGEDTIHVVPDSRNIPVEFAESRWPLRVERLGLAVDSGGPGLHRGGLGYDKHIRMLRDASFMSIADRSILSCWGVNGGRAGRPFTVEIEGRPMEGLVDDAPVRAGEVIRIRTTGGGGWGCPLDRPAEAVAADVRDGKVSVAAPATTTAWCCTARPMTRAWTPRPPRSAAPGCAPCSRRRARSSTGGRAFPCSPAACRTRRWTCCDPPSGGRPAG